MKTAVEFLLEKYKSQNTLLFGEDFEQAKEMEKQQIINFGNDYADQVMGGMNKRAEKYYNEIFKSE
jgi:phage-related protein